MHTNGTRLPEVQIGHFWCPRARVRVRARARARATLLNISLILLLKPTGAYMAPVWTSTALEVPMKKLGTISLVVRVLSLLKPTMVSVMVSGAIFMGANPPVMMVAMSSPISTRAISIVITGQNFGKVFITSSLVGSLLRPPKVSLSLPNLLRL